MAHDDDAIGRHAAVEFERRDPDLESMSKARQRVFRPQRPRTSMALQIKMTGAAGRGKREHADRNGGFRFHPCLAALIGQACFEPGMAKSTRGTACFMLLNTGKVPVQSRSGMLTTPAHQINGRTVCAMGDSIFIAGAAIKWLRDGSA